MVVSYNNKLRKNWEFVPNEIKVKQGDTVTLKITGEDENLWRKTSKDNFFKFYNKSDIIYDQI